MSDFTVKVRPDQGDTGSNIIDVWIAEGSNKSSVQVETEYELYVDEHESCDPSKVALYYAVERIAQLESIVESQKASVLRLAYEDAKERIAQLEADVASNLTMHVAQNKWRQAELERDELLALFEFLEQEARRSRTGISFDWVPTCEGEPSGYRFMRHHHVGQPTKTLRKAIEQGQKRQGEENA